jgi:hypothetical protein
MKTPITAARCRITTTWWNEGSVLRGDYQTGIESLHTVLEVESDSPPEDVSKLIAMSERACYVLSALDRPPSASMDVMLNGEPLEVPD